MCERCAQLEEELAYLKSEEGQRLVIDATHRLRTAMRANGKDDHVGTIGPANAVLALYRARGRILSKWQILEAVPARHGRGEDERDEKIADVWVCRARKGLGREAIETVWGHGFRLSAYGRDLVDRIIGDLPPIPEAVELQERAPEDLRTLAALIAGLLAHKDGDGGRQTAITFRRIADRLDGKPRIAA